MRDPGPLETTEPNDLADPADPADQMAADDPAVEPKPGSSTGLVPQRRSAGRISAWSAAAVPVTVAQSGNPAARRFLEFFAVTVRNTNTRMLYYRACCRFFSWCDSNGLAELADIEPLHVAAYIETLQATFEKLTTKQHLAAIPEALDRDRVVPQGVV